MYKRQLIAKGFKIDSFTADQKKEFNFILSLESKIRLLQLDDETSEDEVDSLKHSLELRKKAFESLLKKETEEFPAEEKEKSNSDSSFFGLAVLGTLVIGVLAAIAGSKLNNN